VLAKDTNTYTHVKLKYSGLKKEKKRVTKYDISTVMIPLLVGYLYSRVSSAE